MDKTEVKILIDKLIKVYKNLELVETGQAEGVVLTEDQKNTLTIDAEAIYREVKPDEIIKEL